MKQSDALMATKIFMCCIKHSRSIPDITKRVYGNDKENNIGRIYKVIEFLITEGVIVPKVNDGHLLFQIDKEIVKELLK